jgi:polynucleotide 5'-kinase involved in rRNA processing
MATNRTWRFESACCGTLDWRARKEWFYCNDCLSRFERLRDRKTGRLVASTRAAVIGPQDSGRAGRSGTSRTPSEGN